MTLVGYSWYNRPEDDNQEDVDLHQMLFGEPEPDADEQDTEPIEVEIMTPNRVAIDDLIVRYENGEATPDELARGLYTARLYAATFDDLRQQVIDLQTSNAMMRETVDALRRTAGQG